MTLLEILVKELPGKGGWPAQYTWAHTDGASLKIVFECPGIARWSPSWSEQMDIESGHVTREQYEAALAESEKVAWNGEGLPPVGVNCEALFTTDDEPVWYSFVTKFIGQNYVVAMVGLEEIGYGKEYLCSPQVKFRPLRSEEERKRDEVTQRILDVLDDYDFEMLHILSDKKSVAVNIAERIAAGEIPHVKIV